MGELATIDHNTATVAPRLPALTAGGPVRAIVPQDFEGAWRIASAVCKAGMAPKGLDTPEKAMVAIMHGLEVGLTPMNALQSIAVVNGRPTVWGDGAIALARGSGQLEWMEEKFEGAEGTDAFKAVCLVKRKSEPKPVRGEFSVADAKKAALWAKAGPWQQYPKRMLQMRARAFTLRDGFADVLKGLAIKEEVEDYQVAPARDEPPKPPARPLPAEELIHVKEPAETVEWTEPAEQEAAATDQPPVPPSSSAKKADPISSGILATHTNVTAGLASTGTTASGFPGDKPMKPAEMPDIPEALRRTDPPKAEVNVEEWLAGLAGALSGCEDTEQLAEIQNKHQEPMKGKVSKADWAKAHTMVMEAFARISEGDE